MRETAPASPGTAHLVRRACKRRGPMLHARRRAVWVRGARRNCSHRGTFIDPPVLLDDRARRRIEAESGPAGGRPKSVLDNSRRACARCGDYWFRAIIFLLVMFVPATWVTDPLFRTQLAVIAEGVCSPDPPRLNSP